MKTFTQNLILRFSLFSVLFFCSVSYAADYHVGPSEVLHTISEVPWATLNAGDRVYIHWKDTPYKEKWVINRKGTAENPIKIIGVNGPEGQQAIIDGNGAVIVAGLNYWNESRGVIKIGGSNIPADDLPEYIIIDNLEIRSARPPFQFTNDDGVLEDYSDNAASIYIEKGANITIRHCTLHDSGNGLFIGSFGGATQTILIEQNYIYDNGIVGSAYQHNSYTSAIGIIFQFNHYGLLKEGANGNNLKDRSAGLVVKYNWLEGGSRLLDLVNADDALLVGNESYSTTHIYGNILVKPEAPGNSQIVHYGGDSGSEDTYRKGELLFYNNTVISTRVGNTTLINISTNDESATVFNNVIFSTASGNHFAMINNNGIFNLHHNWLKPEWKDCHCVPTGTVTDLGDNIIGSDPLFEDFATQNYRPASSSELINNAANLADLSGEGYGVENEYLEHQNYVTRYVDGSLDIGAFENTFGLGLYALKTTTELIIYPNPVKDILTITVPQQQINNFAIYSSLGQLVQTFTTPQINVENLKPGLYFIQGIDGAGKNYVGRFIRE